MRTPYGRTDAHLADETQAADMDFVLKAFTSIALLVVLLVVLAGFWNMMRGGNSNRSQMLMRWRVGLQFLAIVVMMAMVYFLHS